MCTIDSVRAGMPVGALGRSHGGTQSMPVYSTLAQLHSSYRLPPGAARQLSARRCAAIGRHSDRRLAIWNSLLAAGRNS
jgi:hypothetical protein